MENSTSTSACANNTDTNHAPAASTVSSTAMAIVTALETGQQSRLSLRVSTPPQAPPQERAQPQAQPQPQARESDLLHVQAQSPTINPQSSSDSQGASLGLGEIEICVWRCIVLKCRAVRCGAVCVDTNSEQSECKRK